MWAGSGERAQERGAREWKWLGLGKERGGEIILLKSSHCLDSISMLVAAERVPRPAHPSQPGLCLP